jgi:hypothetical protein
MPSCLIDDGYTFSGQVEPIGPWPAVAFRFRPALADRVQQYLDDCGRAKGRADAIVALLKDHVVSWDVEDALGKPVAVTDVNLRRIPFHVRERLADAVCGYSGGADEKNSPTGCASL